MNRCNDYRTVLGDSLPVPSLQHIDTGEEALRQRVIAEAKARLGEDRWNELEAALDAYFEQEIESK